LLTECIVSGANPVFGKGRFGELSTKGVQGMLHLTSLPPSPHKTYFGSQKFNFQCFKRRLMVV